ncbi:MAG: multicopper oxidase family protein, partial [Gemmatimonadales bacterium]|nr:multicopper oxidase family protein [Gemmatimonadales bacterium]
LGPSRDLYCIELVAAPGIAGASGVVELGHLPGPFTVAVGPDGRPRQRLIVSTAGLPSPQSLGPYRTYVAWVAPPTLHPIVRLGEVAGGPSALGTTDLEKFVFLITAESAGRADEPSGRVVLRGQSPSTRLFPPDLLEFSLGRMREGSGSGGEHHGQGHGSTVADSGAVRWTTVPMPEGLTMLPAEMALRPDLTPFLPAGNAPPARPREVMRPADGDTLRLEAGLVTRTLKGREYTMYAFNGQYPGPLIEAVRGSEIMVAFTNRLPQPTTVHWHGIRLEQANDGVPGLSQPAVPPGGRFIYRVRFPDAGVYWYHPHVREDVQQELGLYGNLLVRSARGEEYGPANREAVLMLDDILIGGDGLVPLGEESPTHALMGRFGNTMLVNGEPGYRLQVKRGEVVRFFLTNAANTRTFNLSFPGARIKVVASDVGAYAREAWVESVVIGPAERYVVHVRFDRAGTVALVNRVRGQDHLYGRFFSETDTLGVVEVARERVGRDLAGDFAALRRDTTTTREMERFRRAAARAPEKALVLTLETEGLPAVTRRLMQLDSIYFAPVEWSGTMPMMNWASTGRQVRWILRDPVTGRENMDLDWRFPRGEPVRIRLVNQRQSFHAMQHPIHLHGQRFLILSVNGVVNQHPVWKDTVLLPAGSAVDILLDPSNPGRWMLHCHIAEHLSAGMMMGFRVE